MNSPITDRLFAQCFVAHPPAFDSGAIPAPDINQARAFTDALGGGVFDYRAIHDRDRGLQAVNFRGTIDEVWPQLLTYNTAGYGCFAVVNECDGQGQSTANVTRIRAHYIDLDNLSAMQNLQRANEWSIKPAFMVQSSEQKAHVYWPVVAYQDNERFTAIQRKLIQFFDGDPVIFDAPRVLRMPGTLHQKGAPQLVTCSALSGYGYTTPVEYFEQALAHVDVAVGAGERHPLGDPEKAAPSLAWLQYALDQQDPNDLDRGEWIGFTAAIKQSGWSLTDPDTLYQMWAAWCAKYSQDDPNENRKQWDSIKDAQLGWNSIKSRVPAVKAHATFSGVTQQALPATVEGQGVAAPVRTYSEIYADAISLSEGDVAAVAAICTECGNLNPIERDDILRELKKNTGTSLGALRSMVATTQDKAQEPDHNQIAQNVIEEMGRDNIIMAGAGVWCWDDTGVWSTQEERATKQLVQKRMDASGLMISKQRVDGVADVLKNDIFKPEHEFNLGSRETVNCLNGELTLVQGQWYLFPHNKKNYRTTQIPVGYDNTAQCPKFTQYLNEVFAPDIDRDAKINVILEMMGYTLMSHAHEEKFMMLIGAGANGKSVLLTILEELCGKRNIAAVQPSAFDNIFQRAYLDQKLANIIAELKQGEVIADGELKVIVSGDPSTVENKQGHPFTMHSFATCWFGTNHMPHTRDFSDALFRRAIIVRFNRVFQPHEQDAQMKAGSFWTDELPGILNQALLAYARVLVDGWTVPQSSEAAKHAWRLEADQVAAFVDEKCNHVADHSMKVGHLFWQYQQWAKDNGIKMQVSIKSFRDRLSNQGFGEHRTNEARLVTGIKLK